MHFIKVALAFWPNAKAMYMQSKYFYLYSTVRFCKNVVFAVLFGSSVLFLKGRHGRIFASSNKMLLLYVLMLLFPSVICWI